MNRRGRSAFQLAAAIGFAILLGGFVTDRASAQGPSRGQGYDRGHRDNERVTVEGRIRTIRRERDGYRVELDRGGESFWVPERSLRSHAGEFRVGRSVRLAGLFRGGIINVDIVDWPPYPPVPERRREVTGLVRGVIERIDYRHDLLVLRQEESGRLITVNMIRADRRWNRAVDFDHLRRGDFISLAGDWTPAGRFSCYRIENIRTRR